LSSRPKWRDLQLSFEREPAQAEDRDKTKPPAASTELPPAAPEKLDLDMYQRIRTEGLSVSEGPAERPGVNSMACFGNALHRVTITAKARFGNGTLVRDGDHPTGISEAFEENPLDPGMRSEVDT
jgi:hypothetical protein